MKKISLKDKDLKYEYNYYTVWQILSIVKNEYNVAFKYSEKLYLLGKCYSNKLGLNEYQSIGLLSNLIIDSLNYGTKKFYTKYIEDLNVGKVKNNIEKHKIYLYLKCELQFQFLTQNFEKVNFWNSLYNQYKDCFSNKQNIYLLSDLMVCNYILGDENLFLRYSNDILGLSSTSEKVEEIEKTTYYALLTHFFDTRDIDLFVYHLNSFETRFKTTENTKDIQLLTTFSLFNTLKNIITKKSNINNDLNELSPQFEKYSYSTLGMFDIKIWYESKLENVSYHKKIGLHLKNHFKS